ncbi:hypothetical protein CLV35_2919 [Motilibacter peucedani]|uniref:Putative T7SS secretion signal domain-containing protein n=1 Tax=Motilibacter peucedani TaxID=598650 RepID=A0A420XN16_9ACTN|nr:hypothetical protein [Motilibacter peucedani]RKS72671.1 hypothetical protein CLV35_2919 [Motilibacter peucedani]
MSGPDFSVPGDPGALRGYAQELRGAGTAMGDTAAAVRKASTGPWEGAAEQAWRATQQRIATAWEDASSAMSKASTAVDHYADALESAQKKAATALSSYNDAVADTNKAVNDYNSAVSAGTQTGPFTDPGEGKRTAALSSLSSARDAVEQAGANAATAVRAAAEVAPTSAVMQVPSSPFGNDAVTNGDGAKAGGPVPDLPTDPAALKRLLDLARSSGMSPADYSGLLRQYWAAVAAQKAGIDLEAWDPTKGASGNPDAILAVYRYYGNLFLQHPELQWAGMANLIGPSFAGGFLDLDMVQNLARELQKRIDKLPGPVRDALPEELKQMAALANAGGDEVAFYENTFLAMQKKIFFDQGGMHEAYLDGGMDAIKELQDAGITDRATTNAWQQIHDGAATGNTALLDAGNTTLLSREQNIIIPDQYDAMRNHPVTGQAFTYLLTMVGAPSIPGAHTPAEVSPLSVSAKVPVIDIPFVGHADATVTLDTPLPDFNISSKDPRWDMIINDTLPAYTTLLREHPQEVRDLVASDVGTRVDQQRLASQWDDILRRFFTDWHLHGGFDVTIG